MLIQANILIYQRMKKIKRSKHDLISYSLFYDVDCGTCALVSQPSQPELLPLVSIGWM
jgi:hypothetical protein